MGQTFVRKSFLSINLYHTGTPFQVGHGDQSVSF